MRFRVCTESYYYDHAGREKAYAMSAVVDANDEELARKYGSDLHDSAENRHTTIERSQSCASPMTSQQRIVHITRCARTVHSCRREYNREYGRKRRGAKNPRVFGENGMATAKKCAVGHSYLGRTCGECARGKDRRQRYCRRGHPLNGETTYVRRTRSGRITRTCMTCHKASMRVGLRHPDAVRAAIKNWAARNRDYLRRYHSEYQRRRLSDPTVYAAKLAYNREWSRRAKERGWQRRTRRLPQPPIEAG